MNERDSEAVAAQLVAKGYTLAAGESVADVIVLNTCSVRDLAEQKALRKMENVAAEVRRHRPGVVLGFIGCMAQSRGQELIDRLPDVDLVVGTQKFHRTADYLDDILAGRRAKVVDVAEEQGSEATIRQHLLNGNAQKAATAFVSIMQGCNQYCTFCIVPYTRGQERSPTIPDIVAECRELVGRGVKEITLLGHIVTSYGRRQSSHPSFHPPAPLTPAQSATSATARQLGEPDGERLATPCEGGNDGKSPFVRLLEAVHQIEGLERIRFTSPHPKGYGDDLIEAYGRLPKLVESAHLPVQSGRDLVLKHMHRGYTQQRDLCSMQKLRRIQPRMGISTDIIVGFPSETEEDFKQTMSLARQVEFHQVYLFKYSPRRDTPAAEMADQVPQPIKEERNQCLLQLVNEIGRRKYEQLVGQQRQTLVEGPTRRTPA